MSASSPSLVLFDLDGVLVHYERPHRIAHLASVLACDADAVQAALFDSGLEDRYDAGAIGTEDYLATLGQGLGRTVDRATWTAARAAAMTCSLDTRLRIAALSHRCTVAILTNNGPLLAETLPDALPALFPAFADRVLCSGALGAAKPSPDAYLRAVDLLGHTPQRTLFLDDSFDNVEGARQAGLFAEHVAHAGAFDAILAAYGL